MLYDLSFTTKCNELENKNRIKYDYKVNDLISLDRGTLQRELITKRDGPYQVIRVYSNSTLKIRKGIYVQIDDSPL
jgi:hypothetical protein